MATEQEIITQIEYYLSDKNLERDEFFHKEITKADDGFIKIEMFLKCNKVKTMKITEEDIVKSLANSDKVEINAEAKTIRRKDNTSLPALIQKKMKKNDSKPAPVDNTENKQEEKIEVKIEKPENPLIFSITTESKTTAMHWKLIEEILQKMYSIKPVYVRYSKLANEGNFIIDKKNIEQEVVDKMLAEGIKVGEEYEAKISMTEGDDLETFQTQHGSHYEQVIELAALGKSSQDNKKQNQKEKREARRRQAVRFCGEKYLDLAQLKNSFKGILGRTPNGEQIKEPYHEMIAELLNYHEKSADKKKDVSHFTVDIHPEYNQTRCFFVVKNDGEKVDFSFTKCLQRLDEQRKAAMSAQ